MKIHITPRAIALAVLVMAGLALATVASGPWGVYQPKLQSWLGGGVYVGTATPLDTNNKVTGTYGATVNMRYLALPDAGSCAGASPDQHFNDLDGGTVTNCAYCQVDAGLGVYIPGVKAGDNCMVNLTTSGFTDNNIWHRAIVKEADIVTVLRCGTGWPIPLTALGDAGTVIHCISHQ